MPYLSEIGCDDITISSSIINVACGNSDCEDNRIIDENDFRQVCILIYLLSKETLFAELNGLELKETINKWPAV